VAGYFLRLGLTAFGGPAAYVSLMEAETVQRRRWLSREEFLDMLGACNLIPGPSATQMAMAIGYQRAGGMGLVLGGLCFILPAALLSYALAIAYVRFGALPQAHGLLWGVKPVVLGIIVDALWRLSGSAFRRRWLILLAGFALMASRVGVHPLWVLLCCGMISAASIARSRRTAALALTLTGAMPAVVPAAGLLSVFLFFLKLGAVLFGSGYVLLAFLKADLVDRYRWLTEAQLLDAIAVGQVTPGPLFSTATFIGYLLAGGPGAVLATVGIFLPSFLFVGVLTHLVPRLRANRTVGAFLDGVNAGVLALMVSVTFDLARSALVDGWTVALGLVSATLLFGKRLNPTWLVVGGAAAGLLIHGFSKT
jgi:chromate transporter